MIRQHLPILAIAALLAMGGAPARSDEPSVSSSRFVTRAIRGRVGYLAEALSRRHAVKTVAEAIDRVLVLETPDGQVIPLVEDVRGRSFRLDERLRGIDVELLVRQYEGSPFVQVIHVFAVKKDGKYELDYWCDICAIAMFELKPCDCCQGDVRLRERKRGE